VYEVANGNDFSIVASGSEVNLAFEIQKLLKDYSIQIISAPIVNRINDVVLKKLNLNKKIFTLELGKSIGWSSYIGNVTKSYSIENFGSSAPQDDLKEHFQFSAQFIAEDIKNILN
jgi:transketolase